MELSSGEITFSQNSGFEQIISAFITSICNVIPKLGDDQIIAAYQQFMEAYGKHLDESNQKNVLDKLDKLKAVVGQKIAAKWKFTKLVSDEYNNLETVFDSISKAIIAINAPLLQQKNSKAPLLMLERENIPSVVKWLPYEDAISLKHSCRGMYSLFRRNPYIQPQRFTRIITPRLNSTLPSFIGDEHEIKSVVLSGGRLAVLNKNMIRIFAPFTNQVLTSIDLTDYENNDDKAAQYHMLALPNGRLLVVSSCARIFDPRDGTLVCEHALDVGANKSVNVSSIAILNNRYLITSHPVSKTIHVWDMEMQFKHQAIELKHQENVSGKLVVTKIHTVRNKVICHIAITLSDHCKSRPEKLHLISIYNATENDDTLALTKIFDNTPFISRLLRCCQVIENDITFDLITASNTQICVRHFSENTLAERYLLIERRLDEGFKSLEREVVSTLIDHSDYNRRFGPLLKVIDITILKDNYIAVLLDDHNYIVGDNPYICIYRTDNASNQYKLTCKIPVVKLRDKGAVRVSDESSIISLADGGIMLKIINHYSRDVWKLALYPGTLFQPEFREQGVAQGIEYFDDEPVLDNMVGAGPP